MPWFQNMRDNTIILGVTNHIIATNPSKVCGTRKSITSVYCTDNHTTWHWPISKHGILLILYNYGGKSN